MNGLVLIVDDDIQLVKHLDHLLQGSDYQTLTAHNAADARAKMAKSYPDIVLMDLQLPDANGGQLISELKESYPDTQFIIITAHGSIRSAVESTQRGAADYLTKPFGPDEMLLALRNTRNRQALGEQVRRLRNGEGQTSSRGQLGLSAYPSAAMRKVASRARQAASQDCIVLLLGESGTGKDHLARWIHANSPRSRDPYFSVNCAAVSRELAESELFGHEPGAFTGTRGRKRGLLEVAGQGSLLLNEIGEMEPSLQSKLLSFLDTRSFTRVGGVKSISVDARLFAATNRDLASEVESGRFRRDLFYRLNVFPIRMPSLSDRREDIPMLAEEILQTLAPDMGIPIAPALSSNALKVLASHPWPGNIRELRNVLERALIASRGAEIHTDDLDLDSASDEWLLKIPFPGDRSLHDVTREVARSLVLEALRRGHSKQNASKLLGISRHALAHQIKTLGIEA